MMLTEIIHNLKNKRQIGILVIGIMICLLYLATIKQPITAKQLTLGRTIENVHAERQLSVNYWTDKASEMQLADLEKADTEHIKPGSDELPQEFYAFEGKWEVGEYLNSIVESTGVDINVQEYIEVHEQKNMEIKEKYEGQIFEIREDSIEHFGGASELGYCYDDYAILFDIYRQPPNLGIVPPFLCASIQLKDSDEFFDMIIDGNGEVLFVAEYRFFKLIKLD